MFDLAYRLLDSIDNLVQSLVPENNEQIVLVQETFAIAVQPVDPMNFTGRTFTDSQVLRTGNNTQRRPTAVLNLPGGLFSVINATNSTRITNTVYTTDALYIPRDPGDNVVASFIISASVVGVEVQGLESPIIITFVSNLSNPVRAAFIPCLDSFKSLFSHTIDTRECN